MTYFFTGRASSKRGMVSQSGTISGGATATITVALGSDTFTRGYAKLGNNANTSPDNFRKYSSGFVMFGRDVDHAHALTDHQKQHQEFIYPSGVGYYPLRVGWAGWAYEDDATLSDSGPFAVDKAYLDLAGVDLESAQIDGSDLVFTLRNNDGPDSDYDLQIDWCVFESND